MKKKAIVFFVLIFVFTFILNKNKNQSVFFKYLPKKKKMKYKYTEDFYLSKIEPAEREIFDKKISEICKELGLKKIDLLALMYIESGLKPKAVNKFTNATGLIQFIPSTAKKLGTTVEDLFKMNATEQLFYVRKYFLPFKGKIKNIYDLYLAAFFPAAIGKPNDYILQTKKLSAEKIANQNKAVDKDKNNKITKREVIDWVNKKVFVFEK